jgi:hypothetical protein
MYVMLDLLNPLPHRLYSSASQSASATRTAAAAIWFFNAADWWFIGVSM